MNNLNSSFAEKIALYDDKMITKVPYKDTDVSADQSRLFGNQFYKMGLFTQAIDSYNNCLISANNPELKGIAYANRAAAYLALHSDQDCLDSIRLAKECPLSANLMTKLSAREKIAIDRLQMEYSSDAICSVLPVELSYRHNKSMPSFAFCLTLRDSADPYRGIITTENLLPGDVLVVETPLAWLPRSFDKCEHCRRVCGSLKPCKCRLLVLQSEM